jgi:ubiquinone/menaquinone biosynthesis C-methylase UbiE
MKFRPTLHLVNHDQVIKQYDDLYASSHISQDKDLWMSRQKLYLNYGVKDAEKYKYSERIAIAWRALHRTGFQGKTVLDYGCGSAKAAVVLAQEGAEVVGFDVSSAAIQLGERRVKANGAEKQVRLLVASGGKLPFKTAFFDYIFGYEVLYYLNGKFKFGDEILRVLKPNGMAIFCEALGGNPFLSTVRAILRFATRSISRTGGVALTPKDIEGAFKQASKIETHPVNILSMAKRILRGDNGISIRTLAFLKNIDAWLMRYPKLHRLCGEVVIVVTK